MKRIVIFILVAFAGALLAFALRRSGSVPEGEPRSERGQASTVRDPTPPNTPGGVRSALAPGAVTRIAGDKVAQDDPRASDYDALRLSQMLSVSNFELFDREPRDDVWADGMERTLDDILVEAIDADFEGAEVRSVECRTQSCVVSLTIDDERARSLYSYAQAYMLLGSSTRANLGELVDGKRAIELAVLYDKRFGDADGFRSWRQSIIRAQQTQREQLRRELLGIADER